MRFVLADVRAEARAALRSLVESEWSWTVVAEAQDAIDAARLARLHEADIVLADVRIAHDLMRAGLGEFLSGGPPIVVSLLDLPQQHAEVPGVGILKGTPTDYMRSVIETAVAGSAEPGAPASADGRKRGGD